jgi:hypothetical protein
VYIHRNVARAKAGRQTEGRMDRQANRQKERQTEKESDRHRQTKIKTDR